MSEDKQDAPSKPSGKDEVALELMKFIAVSTGYGKGSPTTGFGGKSATKTPEEYAETLLQLFERCQEAVRKNP